MTAFFDTNILIYRITQADPRQHVARRLLLAGGLISVQVLNEFANVAYRKMKMSWAEINAALLAVRSLAQAVPITVATHEVALTLAEQHKFPIYDALIIASALEAKCTTLYTEDMHHRMTIRQSLQIINPFIGIAGGGS